MNDVRLHEDAFYHLSEPACFVAFRKANGDVELRWRLDYRNFVEDASVTVGSSGTEVRTYRILRGQTPGNYTDTFTPSTMTGDEGAYTDTSTSSASTYYYKVESIVSSAPIPYSTEIVLQPGVTTEPVFWLKSRSFVEESYEGEVAVPMVFGESVRFGTANLDLNSTFRLEILRVPGNIAPALGVDPGKVIPSSSYWNSNWRLEGSAGEEEVVFDSFSTNLDNGAGDITSRELKYSGSFPFRLEYTDQSGTYFIPDPNLEEPDHYFSAALNNRSVSATWFYYNLNPGHQAWRDAIANECDRIVTDEPGDWPVDRPEYNGVFADVVESSFPNWTNVLNPRDMDSSTYGEDMEGLCDAAKSAMGASDVLMINAAVDSIFVSAPSVDRVMYDGIVKIQSEINYRDSYVARITAIRNIIKYAAGLNKPVHLKSHAGKVKKSDIADNDELEYARLYRMIELVGYYLVMNHGVNDTTHTSIGYVGTGDKGHFYQRTMAFPETQLQLGAPDGDPVLKTDPTWYGARKFVDAENEDTVSYVLYNYGDFTVPDPSYTAYDILDGCGFDPSGDWHKLVLRDSLTTTEGSRIEFVPCDLLQTSVGPASGGLVLMQAPPVIPRILSDAHSPIWLSGGEPELELRVINPDSSMIMRCEASLHKLVDGDEPLDTTTFALNDVGVLNDDVAGDGVFTVDLTSEISSYSPGEYELWTYVEDARGYYQYGRTMVRVAADDLAMKFVDKSSESDISYTGTPYSSVAFDYNEDGFEDILVTIQGHESSAQAKSNVNPNGVPQYSELRSTDFAGTGFISATDSRGLTFGDYNNDGDDDLFIAHADTVTLLFENTGPKPSGQYIDSTVEGFELYPNENSWAGSWGDFNADGWLDLYVSKADNDPLKTPFIDADPVADVLLLGIDGTSFVNSTMFSGILTSEQPSFSATWCDVDQDGDMDLFVPAGNADGTSKGARFFETVASNNFSNGLATWFSGALIEYANSAAWADLDNDGDLDLVMARTLAKQPGETARPYVFLKDNGASHFTQSLTALPDMDLPSRDVRPLDYDLDGWMDLLLIPARPDESFVERKPKLFRNLGGSSLKFEDVTDAVGIGDLLTEINGVSIADFDNNGSMDVFFGRPTAPDEGFYYLSDPVGVMNYWLGVELEGSADIQANRSGIGAQVTVKSLDGGMILSGTRSYGGGLGRGGDGGRMLRFGLGSTASSPLLVETRWLNGFIQVDSVATNAEHMISDKTPPTITSGSLDVSVSAAPGELSWSIEWVSDYELVSSIDRVELIGPSTNWASVVISPANALHYHNAKSHGLLNYTTGCAPGTHTITVIMTANDQTKTAVTTKRIGICAQGQ